MSHSALQSLPNPTPAHPESKAVDASRSTHAAIAANEAAALRHLAATVSGVTGPRLEGRIGSAGSCTDGAPFGGSDGGSGGGCRQRSTDAPPPIVQLLGTFTTNALPSAVTATDAAATGGTVAPGFTRPADDPHRIVPRAAHAAAAHGAAPPPAAAPPGRRWRCLVLERLGPSASDVLAGWQRWRRGHGTSSELPPEGGGRQLQAEVGGGRTGPGGGHGSGGAGPGVERGRRPRGLPPAAVRCFASQALAALDLVHRSAGLVHCDVKPDNFALRRLEGARRPAAAGLGGRGEDADAPTLARDPPGPGARASWALLDFGNACSLAEGHGAGERSRRRAGGAMTAAGHVRPCVPPPSGSDSGDGDDGSDAFPWYDTPSYAAPELTLGIAPSPASDMWSLGCTVFELATGRKLLPVPPQALHGGGGGAAAAAGDAGYPDAAEAHLALAVQLLGRPPAGLLARAPRAGWFFDMRSRRMLLEEEFEVPPLRPLALRLRQACRESAAAAGSSPSPAAVGQLGGKQLEGTSGGLNGGGAGGLAAVTAAGGEVGGGAAATAAGHERGLAAGQAAGAHERAPALLWDAREAWADGCASGGSWDAAEVAALHSFLAPLLQWDPRDRPPAHVAARHPWLADGPG